MSVSDILKEHILKEGPISIEKYMETCLYQEKDGYYMKKDPFGKEGDFITAPEITSMYGEVLGAWIIDTWYKMGEPKNWQLIEVGPGRGTLMHDILRTISHIKPELIETTQITLVELSPHLKHIQRNTLNNFTHIRWASHVDDIPFDLPTLLIGNELLDAFPVKQYIKKGSAYVERLVGYNKTEEHFFFTEGTQETVLPHTEPIVEYTKSMESYLCKIKDKLKNGVALFIDYGADNNGESLQAIKNHRFCNVLETPGEADLTAHVNFNNVRRILGVEKTSYTESMGTFLTSIGFALRAAKRLEQAQTMQERKQIEHAAHRLLHPEQMGTLFKVVAYRTHPWDLAGLAFMPQEKEEIADTQLQSAIGV